MPLIDHTNEQHATVIQSLSTAENLAPIGFGVGVERSTNRPIIPGKLAIAVTLRVYVAFTLHLILADANHVAVDENKLRSTPNIVCDLMKLTLCLD